MTDSPKTFDAIPLSAEVRRAVDELGYTSPTPVQLAVFEAASRGQSLVVQARTGTGKTAAFGLPLVDSIVRRSEPNVQALVLCPTRELALQVARELEALSRYRSVRVTAIYGGAPMEPQIEALRSGAQIVCGTPGRVLDHLRRGTLDATSIRAFVLDEADEMLSMGFARELSEIVRCLPKERQGLFFSATIPPDIERMATSQLKAPEFITLSSDAIGAAEIAHYTYSVVGDKREALLRVIDIENPESAIVFCNTKDETERVAAVLRSKGFEAEWLNGDLEQKERERVMARTREGKVRFLVCTDVASRGIDISHLTHVINADFPESAENYVHRTGRTGRAGKTGTAISLITPKDVGNVYLLRLTYKLRPVEKSLPSAVELATRAEQDVCDHIAQTFTKDVLSERDRSVAARLLTRDDAETILAGVVATYFGGEASWLEAESRRRGKLPAPIVDEPVSPTPVVANASTAQTNPVPARGPRRAPPNAERPPRAAADGRGESPGRPDDLRLRRPRRPRDEAQLDQDPVTPRPARFDRGDDAAIGTATIGTATIGFTVSEAPSDHAATAEAGRTPRDFETRGDSDDRPDHGPGRPPRNRQRSFVRDSAGAEAQPGYNANLDVAMIFVNVGRRDGIESDAIHSWLSEVGLSAPRAVRLRDRMTFVDVAPDEFDRAVAALTGRQVGERTTNAEAAKVRSA